MIVHARCTGQRSALPASACLGYDDRSTTRRPKLAEVTVRRAQSADDLHALHALRWQVFVEEQGVPPELESDELDETACQALAFMDGSVAGTGRVVMIEGGEARVGRMAVHADVRRQGIGGQVLRFLETAAAAEGAVEVTLHAQRYVSAFYLAHGYVEEGEPFEEAGIEHIMMRKRLDPAG